LFASLVGVIAGIINEYIVNLPFLLPGILLFVAIETIDLIFMYFKLNAKYEDSETNSEIVPNTSQNVRICSFNSYNSNNWLIVLTAKTNLSLTEEAIHIDG
jgi:hypothetical protein